MNRENFLTLIAHMRTLRHVTRNAEQGYDTEFPEGGFNMLYYSNSCGTPMCIAGHICKLSDPLRDVGPAHAAEWLGLKYSWALDFLFSPYDLGIPYNDITREQAIAALERTLAAGDDYLWLTIREVWGFDVRNP